MSEQLELFSWVPTPKPKPVRGAHGEQLDLLSYRARPRFQAAGQPSLDRLFDKAMEAAAKPLSRTLSTSEALSAAKRFMHIYANMLGVAHLPMPKLVVKNTLTGNWLGLHWFRLKGDVNERQAELRLQRKIMTHELTLERVVAHEMVHHAVAITYTPAEIERYRLYPKLYSGHGKAFLEGAARVNALKGKDFVTVTSDSEYVIAPNTKPYYVFIVDLNAGGSSGTPSLAWAWAAKLTPRMSAYLNLSTFQCQGRLVKTTDDMWLNTNAKIGSGKIAKPLTPEVREKLAKLYEEGKRS